MRDQGLPRRQVADDLGIDIDTLRCWLREQQDAQLTTQITFLLPAAARMAVHGCMPSSALDAARPVGGACPPPSGAHDG